MIWLASQVSSLGWLILSQLRIRNRRATSAGRQTILITSADSKNLLLNYWPNCKKVPERASST
nr:hypothetical protein [Mesorhizobium sp.]